MLRITLLAALAAAPLAAASYPDPVEGDYVVKDFRFSTGETLPELKLHYITIGSPSNPAVLVMHGTTGHARGFLNETFAGSLFGPGQLLDATKYFIIMPDAIGHGDSSKPSDGLRLKFPLYTYDDMVRGHYRLITEKLGVKRLRLVTGTSMGGMHTWVWGYTYPDFMDALMPLASAPVEIGGRNRLLRKMIIDAIRGDPEFRDGEYTKPLGNLLAAEFALYFMTSSPLQSYLQAPTREKADEAYMRRFRSGRTRDPNDMLHAYESSREYNPSPHLEKIKAPLWAINSADDEVNPPELGIMEREIKKVKRGRYILLPTTEKTRGHGTHSQPSIWGKYLEQLLKATAK